MNRIISTLEIFPNELLIETFQYISAYDLFSIFYSLNFRFFLLINSLQNLHFEFVESWDSTQTIIPSFASQIRTLIIKHDQFINFSYFPNIRSLKLCMPTFQQCNAIQPHFLPNLEHLYISNLYYSDNTKQLCRLIFSSAFPYLRTCRINRMTFSDFHSDSSLSLKQLTISPSTWKTNIFQQILNACPNLTHLRIKDPRHSSIQLISKSISPHISLQHLYIHLDSITQKGSEQLESILSIVPNLKTLVLTIDRQDTATDFSLVQFVHMLIQYVPYLHYLKVKIPFDQSLLITLDTIPSIHPLFVYIELTANMDEELDRYLLILSRT